MLLMIRDVPVLLTLKQVQDEQNHALAPAVQPVWPVSADSPSAPSRPRLSSE